MKDPVTLVCMDEVVQLDCDGLIDVKYSSHKIVEDMYWVEAHYNYVDRPIYMVMALESLVKLLVKLDPTGEELVPILEAKLSRLLEECE